MNPEYQALAQRRAEEYTSCATHSGLAKPSVSFTAGALDPVLEEARRAMYRAEAFEEAANKAADEFPKPYTDQLVYGALIKLAQAEREKLKKIIEEGK